MEMSLKMAMKQWELIGNVVIKQWILMDLDHQMDLDVFSKFSVFFPNSFRPVSESQVPSAMLVDDVWGWPWLRNPRSGQGQGGLTMDPWDP